MEKNCATKTKEVARVGETGVKIVNTQEDLESTQKQLAEDTKFLAGMEKNCATKTKENEEAQKTRGEEMTALADTIKLLNDDDALELFKKSLPAAGSFLQLQVTSKEVLKNARHAIRSGVRVRDFRLDLISMSMRGKAVDFGKVTR